jgi:pilus assembly protein CpaD
MTTNTTKTPGRMLSVPAAINLALLLTASVVIVGCKHAEEKAEVTGWNVTDPTQRHPIMVSQQPSKLAIRVARGSHGLSPHQRSQVLDFASKYRSGDAGNSRLVIAAPSGSANEVAAMQAVAELRHMMREAGFSDTAVSVEAYHEDRDPQPPIRISYLRYVAEGPQCGHFATNLADATANLPSPNLGCANQRNLAAQVANPGDLIAPRTMTSAPGERRDEVWQKYLKGEPTSATRTSDERVNTKRD